MSRSALLLSFSNLKRDVPSAFENTPLLLHRPPGSMITTSSTKVSLAKLASGGDVCRFQAFPSLRLNFAAVMDGGSHKGEGAGFHPSRCLRRLGNAPAALSAGFISLSTTI